MQEKIAVVGLGYVGLPVAVAFARRFPGTVGFDIDKQKVAELRAGHDRTGEVDDAALQSSGLIITDDPSAMADATFFVVAVPTPITESRQPDLRALQSASASVGNVMKRGSVVVYESTVYPGVTEEICGPILEQRSGLRRGVDFTLGYSPERINPGDKEHTLERIIKVVSGEDAATLERVASTYGAIVPAGVHRAPTIQVAEAAKVIENTQRDLNIALMNELSIIFDRMNISTRDVLSAARTKWNFLPFTPGLVGGHCIGVDPYYLTARAQLLGYHPEIILAGRRINDGMGALVAKRMIKLMVGADKPIKNAKIGVLGLTFKEDVPDLRNSRVPDILAELKEYGIQPLVHDPLADPNEAVHEYGLQLHPLEALQDLDGLIVAVAHKAYREQAAQLLSRVKPGGVVVDVKWLFQPSAIPSHLHYWSL